jgi:hypothetical protein
MLAGPLPPGAHQERNHGEQCMPDQYDRAQIDVDRADRRLIQQAAAQLRHRAIMAAYGGLEHKHVAFALALVLDELALHLRGLGEDLRAHILAACQGMLGQQ